MDFDNYSLPELRKLKTRLREKISQLETTSLKELFDKIRPLIFTDKEWESLNSKEKEIYDLYYKFYSRTWIATIGLFEFRTFYDWETENQKVEFDVQGYRTLNERDQMLKHKKEENPLFYIVGKRLESKELHAIMEQYENMGLEIISLVDMYRKFNA